MVTANKPRAGNTTNGFAYMMRMLDLVISVLAICVLIPVFVILTVLVWFDHGSPLFWQKRVGRYRVPFMLVKFRTMKIGTPCTATHHVDPRMISRFGSFMRKTKLDELPQLWNVVRGDMSLVGPRPCLLSQSDLIEKRHIRSVFVVRPGMTGLAQIRGIDMSDPLTLAEADAEMVSRLNIKSYFQLIFITLIRCFAVLLVVKRK